MWYKKIILKLARWGSKRYITQYIEDLPKNVDDKTIYIIGDKQYPWLLLLNCPCGCQSLIQLNLLKEGDPCWTYRINRKHRISVSPSIRRIKGCRSHFLVQNGEIKFVKSFESFKRAKSKYSRVF